jgi:hypothetical protein
MKLRPSAVLVIFLVAGCNDHEAATPTSPSSVFQPPPAIGGGAGLKPPGQTPAGASAGLSARSGPLAFIPLRPESLQFRLQLEDVYRSLGYPLITTYVDPEGSVTWITEFAKYRTQGCSSQESTAKVNFIIDNLTSPAPPGCGGSAGFPERPDSFVFRTEFLEPKYRDGLRRPLQSLYVNAEGDVIWTTEYMRYRDSGCSQAVATDRVNQAVRNPSMPGPPDCRTAGDPTTPPTARFSVFPNPGTNVNPPQCSVTSVPVGSGSRNQLRCTFDAGDSTPLPGITSFSWTFEGQDNATATSGQRLQNNTLPCGSFGATGAGEVGKTVERNVRLQVTSPGGTNSTAGPVTFVKAAPC